MTPTRPITVAFVRGLIYAAVAGLLASLIALTPADLEGFGPWAPLLAVVLPTIARTLEGAIFDRRQPPQAGLLGGEPAVLYDWLDDDLPEPV